MLKPGDTVETRRGSEEITSVSRPNAGAYEGDVVYIETASGLELERDPNDALTSIAYA
jgi:hypothetical protein